MSNVSSTSTTTSVAPRRIDASQAVSIQGSVAAGRLRVLPLVELVVLIIAAAAPMMLKDYITVYATRVLILCLFALSFDLVWGYAGIMSFGQAVFFGTAGYGVAL